MTSDKEEILGAAARAEYPPAHLLRDKQEELPDHLIRLPGGEWSLWRCAGLRGSGFPVEGVLRLSVGDAAARADELIEAEEAAETAWQEALSALKLELKGAALEQRPSVSKALHLLKKGRVPEGVGLSGEAGAAVERMRVAANAVERHGRQYTEAFSRGLTDTSKAIRDIARDERFREAIIWQNRGVIHSGIDPILRKPAESFRDSKDRRNENLIASYWQRYCTKNDTIGFFGPVGWANFVSGDESVIAIPGPSLLDSRNTYFEAWCIDAVAEKIAKNRNVLPWIAPRRRPIIHVEGTTLYLPFRGEISISPEQSAVLLACDGQRTAKQIASDLIQDSHINLHGEAEVFSILEGMRARGLIVWEFDVPIGAHPDRILRAMVERIEDSALRGQALNDLDDIENARDAVARAAGDAEKLNQALGDLEATFTRLTGTAPTRSAGKTYAGRTLVYEDCRRDIELKIGARVLTALGPALSLLLTAARWFTYEVGRSYREVFERAYKNLASSSGSSTVEFVKFWQQVQPILFGDVTHPCKTLLPSFQKRWAEVLSIDPGQRRVSYTTEALRPRVSSAFNAPAPGWRWARYNSPDFMIGAPSAEAIQRGDFTLVLGELHMAVNSLSGLLFFEQHPSRDDLLQASSRDVPPPRVVPFPPKTWPSTMARSHFTFTSPEDFNLEFEGASSGITKLRRLPGVALVVEPTDGELIVRTRDGQLRFDILEIFAHPLSMQSVNYFKILETKGHSPRITLDRLVVSRETWNFAPEELDFVYEKDAADRFVAARRWARELDLPRFVFARVPVEIKPFYLDFDSPIYVDTFATFVRRTLESELADPVITVTEMLPDPNNIWLPDAEGRRYTSEIRIVAVDPAI